MLRYLYLNLHLIKIDNYEINEEFAVVSHTVNKLLNLDEFKVIVDGGARAFGHPIKADGARILEILIHKINKHNCEYGLAA
jgi:acetyl-CoA acetyltransferase